MTLIGYMRVSTKKQDTQLQYDALIIAGVKPDDIYKDVISGKTITREGLDNCMARLEPGDILVIWRLDRLGRSTRHLLGLIEGFNERKIGFKSIMDPLIDTTSASGELVFTVLCAVAQFERRLAQERIKAGITAVMEAGRPNWGKRPANEYNEKIILELVDRDVPQREIARQLGISKNTVARVIRRMEHAVQH